LFKSNLNYNNVCNEYKHFATVVLNSKENVADIEAIDRKWEIKMGE
jgi:hypothetical protein